MHQKDRASKSPMKKSEMWVFAFIWIIMAAHMIGVVVAAFYAQNILDNAFSHQQSTRLPKTRIK